jgi:uncharacterized protein (DUF1697 family)
VSVQIALLRGINLGSRNRISMPELRGCLEEAGFKEVRTYLQSGNVVLSGGGSSKTLARKSKDLIAECFGLDIEVIVRTRDELAEVVKLNPLGKVAKDPKRYQVSFLGAKPNAEVVKKLESLVVKPEGFVVIGKEAYAWHPEGVARSKLWNQLAGKGLGVPATARNWTTVTKLLEMADDSS